MGWALRWRGVTYGLPEKREEARILSTRVFATARKVLGPEHRETLRSMNILASTLYGQGKLDEARALYEKYLPIYKRVLGPEHPETLRLMCEFGRLCQDLGNLEKARQLGEESCGHFAPRSARSPRYVDRHAQSHRHLLVLGAVRPRARDEPAYHGRLRARPGPGASLHPADKWGLSECSSG